MQIKRLSESIIIDCDSTPVVVETFKKKRSSWGNVQLAHSTLTCYTTFFFVHDF